MNDRITLQDPELPDSNLDQIGYKLFAACGLTCMLFGPGPLNDCFAAVVEAAPDFHDTQAAGPGLGRWGNREDGLWIAYEGPSGALIAYFCMPKCDTAYVLRNILNPLKGIGGNWSFDLGSVGAEVPSAAGEILAGAHAVPVWTINALASLAPRE